MEGKMKILGISAGTKNGGNDGMCREALMAAKDAGAEVEFINLYDLNIKHCTGCTACVQAIFTGKGNMCVLKDDFDWLLNKMYDADGILFAVPIFEKGELVYEEPDIDTIKKTCAEQIDKLWGSHLRFENPQTYYVDLSKPLWNLKHDLLNKYGASNL